MENKEDLIMAYVAGLIDGDGSISLIRENRASGFKYYPCIQLSNIFEGMINLLHQTFGGCKKIKTHQSHAKKTQYVWNVRGLESCIKFLEKVLPFLVLKKKQAKVLLDYVKNPKHYNVDAEKMKIQSLNNESLVSLGSVSKQADKNTSNECFWAYFAGILETEGSFSIRKNKPSWGCVNYKYNPLIQLSMASFETMNFIRQNICLGSVCFPKAKTTQRGHTYKYLFGSVGDCIEVINKILPYLRFKKEVALELLNFCENYTPIKHKKVGVSLEELKFREDCYQKIKQINESGIVKPSLIDSEALKLGDEGQAGKPCSLND
jgi:hypothetical protein